MILATAVLLCGAAAQAETEPQRLGWRLPITGEIDAPFRNDDPQRYLRANGDFNGDGQADTAHVLVSETLGANGYPSAIGAFVWLSQPGGDRVLEVLHILEHPLPVDFSQFGVAARPPGRYVTACGAGYGDGCAPGEPDAVELGHDGIECGLFESVTGLFWWDPAAGRFEGVPISD